MGPLHLLHLPRLPAIWSGTVILALQCEQLKVIGMAVTGP
jgi:hypothetical protein